MLSVEHLKNLKYVIFLVKQDFLKELYHNMHNV